MAIKYIPMGHAERLYMLPVGTRVRVELCTGPSQTYIIVGDKMNKVFMPTNGTGTPVEMNELTNSDVLGYQVIMT